MIQPIVFRFHGDRASGENLRGAARRCMMVLESMMVVGGVDNQKITFAPNDGSVIVAHKFFGQRVIDIYAGAPAPITEAQEPLICLCNCNLSVGWVLEEQADTINGSPLYTVMACNDNGRVYIPYRNVLASDWTQYVVGQMVVMIPYQSMSFLCCTDKSGGGGPRGCKPTKSSLLVDDHEWRSTYRIIPWCGYTLPREVEQVRWNTNG